MNYYYYYYWQNADLRHVLWQTLTLRHVRGIFSSFEAEMPPQIKFPTSKYLLKDPLIHRPLMLIIPQKSLVTYRLFVIFIINLTKTNQM